MRLGTDELCALARSARRESELLRKRVRQSSQRCRIPSRPAPASPVPVRGPFPVVALAASAGGFVPLWRTLEALPPNFPAAVVVLLHRTPPSRLDEFLKDRIPLPVREAAHGQPLKPGLVLVAPTCVHMGVDRRGRVVLQDSPPVNFTRPAADVLFRSLADSFGEQATAVVFSGMGRDGAAGTSAIRRAGGLVIAQDAASAEYANMPVAAVDLGKVDLVLRTEQIAAAIRLHHPAFAA